MPVSAKEMRRQSITSINSIRSQNMDKDKSKDKGKGSVRSVGKETLSRMLEAEASSRASLDPSTIDLPSPPFLRSTNSSASSLSSAATVGADSDVPETPSLSRSSSVTDEEPKLRTPPGTLADRGSVGVVVPSPASGPKASRGTRASGEIELKVNDVTVEIIDHREQQSKKDVSVSGPPTSKKDGDRKVERRGTLKKMWKRVIGSVSISAKA